MSAEAAMAKYYGARAPYYERVFHKPERQPDLRLLRERVTALCAGKNVLEIACGTGYWTELIAASAASVVAGDQRGDAGHRAHEADSAGGGDLSPRRCLCAAAFAKTIRRSAVRFLVVLQKARLEAFLGGLHRALEPGSTVIAFDNAYVEGSSTPLSRKDSDGNPLSDRDEGGNTYQERVLDDGSRHQIVKNFPSEEELRAQVAGTATDVEVTFLTYYWLLTYSTTGG